MAALTTTMLYGTRSWHKIKLFYHNFSLVYTLSLLLDHWHPCSLKNQQIHILQPLLGNAHTYTHTVYWWFSMLLYCLFILCSYLDCLLIMQTLGVLCMMFLNEINKISQFSVPLSTLLHWNNAHQLCCFPLQYIA